MGFGFGFSPSLAARRNIGFPAVPVQKVIVTILAGQSNMDQRGSPRRAGDVDMSNVYQYGGYSADAATYRKIVPDITPLLHMGGYAHPGNNGDHVGPGEFIPRQMIDDGFAGPNDKILLVPCAEGATALVSDNAPWASGLTPGSGGANFENMVDQANAAIAAVASQWPDHQILPVVCWAHGERDSLQGISKSAYQNAFYDLIDHSRARITGATSAPWLSGSMLPRLWTEGHASYDARYAAINEATVAASLVKSNVKHTVGPDSSSDNLHYGPDAAPVEAFGRAIGGLLSDSIGPSVTSATTIDVTEDSTLSITLTSDAAHATFAIDGGTDAADFEISDPYLAVLRFKENGTKPYTGVDDSYEVRIRARDGAGNFGATRTITVSVLEETGTPPVQDLLLHLDASDLSTLFQFNDGTTPVASDSEPVGYWADKSQNGNDLSALFAGASTQRPLYRSSGGIHWLDFDGTNDMLRIESEIGLYTAGAASIFMAIRANPAGASDYLMGLGSSTDNDPLYNFTRSGSVTSTATAVIKGDDGTTAINFANLQAGTFNDTDVVFGVTDSGSQIIPYLDGVAGTPISYTRPAATFDRFAIGGLLRGAASSNFSARVHGVLIYKNLLTPPQVEFVTSELANLQGRSI